MPQTLADSVHEVAVGLINIWSAATNFVRSVFSGIGKRNHYSSAIEAMICSCDKDYEMLRFAMDCAERTHWKMAMATGDEDFPLLFPILEARKFTFDHNVSRMMLAHSVANGVWFEEGPRFLLTGRTSLKSKMASFDMHLCLAITCFGDAKLRASFVKNILRLSQYSALAFPSEEEWQYRRLSEITK